MQHVEDQQKQAKQREWLVFLGLTLVVAPLLAVAVVGGYGFTVWFYQIINGPPTG